ncbi:hypothetical protein [Alloacidobacterium sp.]|uniref:hypothetical protein n=1 Tax=Alloacidobacterium sp. TaxID=2951999 RepID=UPI002D6B9856|nr:hypothetical protein [Alloacidobacterium sp.]HYK35963.1 hypothetical protein [Alloacidobacterium sp.]
MACCGQQRAALVQGKATGEPSAHYQDSSVNVRFKHASAILVRGPVTGRHYQFNGTASTLRVDGRDAAALIKSGYFQQV